MFDGFIRDWACWTPRAPAVITPGGALAYAQLDADVDRVAGRLLDLDLVPQAAAAVAMDDAYLQLATMAALARLGLASAPAGDPDAGHTITEASLGPGVLDAEPRPLPVLELDLDAAGRIDHTPTGRVVHTWRRIEATNFAGLRTLAAGRTGAFLPLAGLDTPAGFALAVCAWSCGGAVATGFSPHDLPAALESLPPGVATLTPAQLEAVLRTLPHGFRLQPAWRLAIAGAPLPPPLARDAVARLTPDVWVLYGAAGHPLVALGPANDDALVPLSGVRVEVTLAGEIHVDGAPTGDHGRLNPDGRLAVRP